MDKLLQHCGNENVTERAMDSNEHEKERGITITSKYTRLYYGANTLHVVDTPGHADFGGEVIPHHHHHQFTLITHKDYK